MAAKDKQHLVAGLKLKVMELRTAGQFQASCPFVCLREDFIRCHCVDVLIHKPLHKVFTNLWLDFEIFD